MATQNLSKAVDEIFRQYVGVVEEGVDEALKETADEAVEMLEQTSPRDTGDYAKGWTVDKQNAQYVVHNSTDYQLTHLLENGHDVVVNGKKVGYSKPKKHIKQVERFVQDEVVKKVEEKLK